MNGNRFTYSSAPLRRVDCVQFGILSPEEIVCFAHMMCAQLVFKMSIYYATNTQNYTAPPRPKLLDYPQHSLCTRIFFWIVLRHEIDFCENGTFCQTKKKKKKKKLSRILEKHVCGQD